MRTPKIRAIRRLEEPFNAVILGEKRMNLSVEVHYKRSERVHVGLEAAVLALDILPYHLAHSAT